MEKAGELVTSFEINFACLSYLVPDVSVIVEEFQVICYV